MSLVRPGASSRTPISWTIQRRLALDRRFEPGLNQICTVEDVTDVEVTPAGILHLAERTLFGEGSRRAFVGPPGAMKLFGLIRMFEVLTLNHPDVLRVQFDHLPAALKWIGVPTPEEPTLTSDSSA